MIPQKFYEQPAVELAPALLGCEIIHDTDQGVVAGQIVETEAYTQDDPASHSYVGPTKRNGVMFGPAGFAYVYFTYGMHYCVNVVAAAEGRAEAVLIRALKPTQGLEIMQHNRQTTELYNLCSGPAKLVQALGISPAYNGASLTQGPLHLNTRTHVPTILSGPRIGIRKAADVPWRFFVADSPFVTSHRFNKISVPLHV